MLYVVEIHVISITKNNHGKKEIFLLEGIVRPCCVGNVLSISGQDINPSVSMGIEVAKPFLNVNFNN